jgi:hypothetical protein
MKRQNIQKMAVSVLTLLLLPVFSACNDPVFYTISQEVQATEARIKGTPTNIVVLGNYMYVASNALFRYKGDANPLLRWTTILPPEGRKISHLAATKQYLYALCSSGSGERAFLYRVDPDPLLSSADWNWEEIKYGALLQPPVYPYLFSIYADSERLFVGAWNGNGESSSPANYAIFQVDDGGDSLVSVITGVGALSGAVWDGGSHFLSTGYGIYTANEPPVPVLAAQALVPGSSGVNFPGIIQLKPGGQIVAVDRNGYIYHVAAGGISHAVMYSGSSVTWTRTGYRATGALAVWKRNTFSDTDPPELLLVGIQGDSGSSNYGYREINLDTSGNLPVPVLPHPPGLLYPGFPWLPGLYASTRTSSIIDGNSARYETTLGHRPVYYLYQAPKLVDSNMTLFAATATDGLFSYRYRNDDGADLWNAEE